MLCRDCSIAMVRFSAYPDHLHCVIGVTKDYHINPRSVGGGFLYTYRMTRPTATAEACMELVHKTVVDEAPYAICPFQGKVLIGVGKLLRLYDMGKKKLLRKSENKHIPNTVVDIKTVGDRIIASDIQDSVHFVKYRRGENQLVIFADDTSPRWITTTCVLDYATVACADKFGNLAVCRLPSNVNDNVDDDPTGTKSLWDRGLLSGASQKAETVSMFHVGETIMSLQVRTVSVLASQGLRSANQSLGACTFLIRGSNPWPDPPIGFPCRS